MVMRIINEKEDIQKSMHLDSALKKIQRIIRS